MRNIGHLIMSQFMMQVTDILLLFMSTFTLLTAFISTWKGDLQFTFVFDESTFSIINTPSLY